MTVSAVTACSNYSYALIMASQALAVANTAQREVVHAQQVVASAERIEPLRGVQVDVRV